jgi:hypothetical protein
VIRKTDRYLKRFAFVHEHGDETVIETVRRETWLLFWVIPIFSKDTILSKPS